MRKLIFLLLIPSASLAQKEKSGILPYENEKITFSRVVILDSNYSKHQLYSNALAWAKKISSEFNGSITREQFRLRDNIFMQDKDSGTVSFEHRFVFQQLMATSLYSYEIEVKVKDGLYQYTITDFKTLAIGVAGMVEPTSVNTPLEPADLQRQKNRMRAINGNIVNLVSELEKSMRKLSKSF